MESQLHRPHEDDPQRTVEGESEQQHKEKKSVMKKVKEKAKKIKNTITKHGHGHKHGNEQGGEPREGKYERQRDDQKGAEDKEVEDETVNDPEIHGAPIYESTVIRCVDLPEEANIKKEINPPIDFDTTKSNLDAATKLDHSKDQKQLIEHEELEPEETKRVTFEQEQPMIFDKDSAVSKKELEPGQESVAEPEHVILQETVNVSTATTTEPASEARHEKPITETVSEYAQKIAEKLKPGDEDKAMSEAVTDTLQKTTEGMHLTSKPEHEEGPTRLAGKVTESEEVKAQLGPVDQSKREGEDAFQSGLESSGDTVVDRVKDAVGSWLGKSEGTRTAQESLGESYANNGGGRGGGISEVAGGDGGGQR